MAVEGQQWLLRGNGGLLDQQRVHERHEAHPVRMQDSLVRFQGAKRESKVHLKECDGRRLDVKRGPTGRLFRNNQPDVGREETQVHEVSLKPWTDSTSECPGGEQYIR